MFLCVSTVCACFVTISLSLCIDMTSGSDLSCSEHNILEKTRHFKHETLGKIQHFGNYCFFFLVATNIYCMYCKMIELCFL